MVDYPSNSPISGVTFTSDPRLTSLGVPAGGNYAAGLGGPSSGGGGGSLPAAITPAAGSPVPPANVPSNLPYSAPSTTAQSAPARLAGGPEAGMTGFTNPYEGSKLNPTVAAKYANLPGHYDVPVGIRVNNMGGISNRTGLPGQVGVISRPSNEKEGREANTYAVFGTPEDGIAAAAHLLQAKSAGGTRSLGSILSSWAKQPGSYVQSIQRFLPGVDANSRLDFNDRATLKAVLMGMSAHESGAGAPSYEDSIYDWGVAKAIDPSYPAWASGRGGAPPSPRERPDMTGIRPSTVPSRDPALGATGGRLTSAGEYNAPGAPASITGGGRTGDEQRAYAFARGLGGRFGSAAPGPTGGGLTPSELTATDAFGQAQGAGPGVGGGGEAQLVSRGTTSADTGQGASGLRGEELIGLPGAPPPDRFAGAFQPGDEAQPPAAPTGLPDQAPVADIPSPRPQPDVHIVQPGDNLWTIAGGDPALVREIARTNGIRNPNLIQPGQLLVMPAPAESNVPIPRQRPDRTEGLVAGGGGGGLVGSEGSLGQRDYARGLLDTPGIGSGGEEIPFNRPPSYRDPGLATPTEVDRMRQELERMKRGALPIPPGRNLGGQGSTYDPQRASDLGGNGGTYASNLVGGESADELREQHGLDPREWPLSGAGGASSKTVPGGAQRVPEWMLPSEGGGITPRLQQFLNKVGRQASYAELLRGGYA